MYTEIYEKLSESQKTYLAYRLLGFEEKYATKLAKVEYQTVQKWKGVISQIDLEVATEELMPLVRIQFGKSLNVEALIMLREVLDFFKTKGYEKLDRFEMGHLINAIQVAMKVFTPKQEGGQTYEEMILKISKKVTYATDGKRKENIKENAENLRLKEGEKRLLCEPEQDKGDT